MRHTCQGGDAFSTLQTPLVGVNRLKKSPRHAVCCAVLNLLSQVGCRPRNFALAEAYRVAAADKEPFLKRVGSKREVQNHGHSRVIFLIPQFKTTVQRIFLKSTLIGVKSVAFHTDQSGFLKTIFTYNNTV
jgi:hypothetical protein